MKEATLADLQESVQDKSAFRTLDNYLTICHAFLSFVGRTHPTRIVSPSHPNYIFYQYGEDYGHKITRPLNVDLFVESITDFRDAFEPSPEIPVHDNEIVLGNQRIVVKMS